MADDVVVFRQDRDNEQSRKALYRQLLKGRLRQGWAYDEGWDLQVGKKTWMRRYRAGRAEGDSKGTPKSVYEKIAGMLKIKPGCLIVVPNQPDNDHFQIVRSVLASRSNRYPCYTFKNAIQGDFRHCVSIDQEARIERRYSEVPKYLRDALTSGFYRAPVQFVRDPNRAAGFREYYMKSLSGEQPGVQASPIQSPTVVNHPALDPFVPNADGDVVARIKGGKQIRTRKHETLVRKATAYLGSHLGLSAHRNHPIDLFISKPREIIFEAKVHGDGSPASVREAVGQLFWYRYTLNYPNAALCVLLDSRPTDIVIEFMEKGMKIYIAWMDGDRMIGGPKSAPALSLEKE